MSIETEEKKAFWLPIVSALAIPFLIGVLRIRIFRLFSVLVVSLVFLAPLIVFVRALSHYYGKSSTEQRPILRNFTLWPPFIIVPDGLERVRIPWVTLGLIVFNCLIHVGANSTVYEVGMFLPMTPQPSCIHIALSLVTSGFLHADISHIVDNMIFLWAFGTAVESRIGPWRFLHVYFFALISSSVLSELLLILKQLLLGEAFNLMDFHSLGASGAIAGITAVFAVRCYFSNVKIYIPFLFLPIPTVPVRLPSLLILGIFFAGDTLGSMQMLRNETQIDYWGHLGGYLAGFAAAYMMNLYRDSFMEAYQRKARYLAEKAKENKSAKEAYTEIFKRDEQNLEALQKLFELNRFNEEKRSYYFSRLVTRLAREEFPEAARLVEEHFPKFLDFLPGDLLLKLGLYFSNTEQFDKAWVCLDRSCDKEGPWQPKALFNLAEVYRKMGRDELANKVLERLVASFPWDPTTEYARCTGSVARDAGQA